MLTAQGIDPYTLKDRIRADIVWQQIVRGKYPVEHADHRKEVASAMEARKKDDDKPRRALNIRCGRSCFVVTRNAGDEAQSKPASAMRKH